MSDIRIEEDLQLYRLNTTKFSDVIPDLPIVNIPREVAEDLEETPEASQALKKGKRIRELTNQYEANRQKGKNLLLLTRNGKVIEYVDFS